MLFLHGPLQLVAMVTPLYPLCTVVSHMNFQIEQTLSENQIMYGNVGHNRSYGHFCDFLAHFG